ncbi:unnamed protein product, partial [Diamesa serratosioi]
MSHQLLYKYGTVYRQIMNAEGEWCSLMGKDSRNNPILDMFINMVRKTAPGITHECPYISPNEFAVRFTGVECSVSDKNSTNYHFCNVKAFSRKVTALNFGFRLIRELNTFNMNHQIFYKYGTIYRQVMKANAEWCSLMGKNSKNILLDMFINVVKETAPGITHECPYM